MKKEELIIGKRYKTSSYIHGISTFKNGIFYGFNDEGAGIFITVNNKKWLTFDFDELEVCKNSINY